MKPWWRTFYPRLHAWLGDGVADPAKTKAEVEWIWRAAGLGAGSAVLDLGCGAGRHAIPLARRGARVQGIDVSESLIGAARSRAEAEGLTGARFHVGDFRQADPSADETYDAVLMMDSVVGVFPEQTTRNVLRTAAARLRAGGRLLLSQANPDWWHRNEGTWTMRSAHGRHVCRHVTIDRATGRLEDRVSLTDPAGTVQEVLPTQVLRLYSAKPLCDLLEAAGLGEIVIETSPDGEPVGSGPAPELYVSAARPVA